MVVEFNQNPAVFTPFYLKYLDQPPHLNTPFILHVVLCFSLSLTLVKGSKPASFFTYWILQFSVCPHKKSVLFSLCSLFYYIAKSEQPSPFNKTYWYLGAPRSRYAQDSGNDHATRVIIYSFTLHFCKRLFVEPVTLIILMFAQNT